MSFVSYTQATRN